MDRVIYAWFGQQHVPDLMAPPNAAAGAPIPMVNVGAGENQVALEGVWDRLATGPGQLQIHTHGGTAAADRTKLLGDLAAALRTPAVTGGQTVAYAAEAQPGSATRLQVLQPTAGPKMTRAPKMVSNSASTRS